MLWDHRDVLVFRWTPEPGSGMTTTDDTFPTRGPQTPRDLILGLPDKGATARMQRRRRQSATMIDVVLDAPRQCMQRQPDLGDRGGRDAG